MNSSKSPMLKLAVVPILSLTILILIGCGTDVSPNYFIGMFRDDGDIDRLSECLSEVPEVDDTTITIKSDKQCLIDLSNSDTSDPNVDASFTEILNDPETYMDRILNFEAIVKKARNDWVELYTNRKSMRFEITAHGANLRRIDEDGKEVNILANAKYSFKCRINEIKIRETGIWYVYAEFIVTEDKKVLYPPILAK